MDPLPSSIDCPGIIVWGGKIFQGLPEGGGWKYWPPKYCTFRRDVGILRYCSGPSSKDNFRITIVWYQPWVVTGIHSVEFTALICILPWSLPNDRGENTQHDLLLLAGGWCGPSLPGHSSIHLFYEFRPWNAWEKRGFRKVQGNMAWVCQTPVCSFLHLSRSIHGQQIQLQFGIFGCKMTKWRGVCPNQADQLGNRGEGFQGNPGNRPHPPSPSSANPGPGRRLNFMRCCFQYAQEQYLIQYFQLMHNFHLPALFIFVCGVSLPACWLEATHPIRSCYLFVCSAAGLWPCYQPL